MIVGPELLEQHEFHAFRVASAFLKGRMEERNTVDWALRLNDAQRAQRSAVARVLFSEGKALKEPWKEAWRLIEESWSIPTSSPDHISGYGLRERLHSGERSGALIGAIVNNVTPRLRVESFSQLYDRLGKEPPAHPRNISDLFSVRLETSTSIKPPDLEIDKIDDCRFLIELATALDLSAVSTLTQGRRFGWDAELSLWRWGGLNRVCFIAEEDREDGEHEPDEFSHGISALVKVLHATVHRLSHISIDDARTISLRWRQYSDPIHARLWACFASSLATPDDSFHFLKTSDQRSFWDVDRYPEITELRAKVFSSLSDKQQRDITSRIRRGPPQYLWPRDVEANARERYQRFMALRELRRIELSGGELSMPIRKWYEVQLAKFPEIREINRKDDGFPGTPKARSAPANPDRKYDFLADEERLQALERGLAERRVSWNDDPGERAADWISDNNVLLLIADFEQAPNPSAFPKVWERFGWAHRPGSQPPSGKHRGKRAALRVAALLMKLTDPTITAAIEGLTWWLSVWSKQLGIRAHLWPLWRKMWSPAETATNAKQTKQLDVESTFETAIKPSDADDIDTLNNPVGRLAGVFLSACPKLDGKTNPFDRRPELRKMRDQLVLADGHASLVAIHRLLEELPYFLKADESWTKQELITPLKRNDAQALKLWHAIARRTQFRPVVEILAKEMVERSTDLRLSRTSRQSLVFSLVVECLHALREKRESVVSFRDVTQMLRSVEDEVRAHAADVLQQFLRQMTGTGELSRESLFAASISPFLSAVWPQERSLATPGVARAFADMPSASGACFAEAVHAVSRFLVPFDAWSSMEYGLYGDSDGSPKLDAIDTETKAQALLQLLNATVGTAEGSVIPSDLSDMLSHIRKMAPPSAQTPAFRRLATSARV